MKLFGMIGTPDAPKRVIPVDTDRALELIVGRTTVVEAIEAFIEQAANVRQTWSWYGRRANPSNTQLLGEAHEALVAALDKEGIKLVEVPGTHDRSIDESVETFVAAYQKQKAERLITKVAPLEVAPEVHVAPEANKVEEKRAA